MHKRKKMKGSVEVGGIVSVLTKNEDFTIGAQTLSNKCRDPEIFSVPCTIGEYTFANGMLDLNKSSSANILYDFDPKIELTLCRIRKVRNIVVSSDSINTSPTSENSVSTTNTIDFSTTNSFFSLNNYQQ
ncbi:hypothetical protein CR513_09455, partial [Mucuna pruriens]